ncbi:DivIVA domain-containing protein [Streptomyces sp. NPDC127106]|uniref:DivIVA domain-containing protein n=1 Tax=Streptomyces sp. NPDC127106 TaxID=3345360 RepID=UPI00363FBC47
MFWFLLIALVVVVAAVTLAVVGGGSEPVLPEAEPDRVADALPDSRPVVPADIDALRLPVAPRGYRMAEVDDVLERLAAELAERDARIAELTAAAVHHATPAAATTATATATATVTAPAATAPARPDEDDEDDEAAAPKAVDLSKDAR